MVRHSIDAIPFHHDLFPKWRSYKAGGIRYFDSTNQIELCGVLDDIWVNKDEELIIVDYKATARKGSVLLDLSNAWNSNNKRQVSFYAYILKTLGFKIHKNAYCLYVIADNSKPALNENLAFETKVLPYCIDYSWIEKTIVNIRNCLDQELIPDSNINCDLCKFNF
ncbi:hypothetical protein Noda2021_04040 [Candidatus Dependentiae bacterium Noda2021]|nr:hypothetical protein Noda2021_04040 [Candidatus Dependentiae bacterium Noda2021]